MSRRDLEIILCMVTILASGTLLHCATQRCPAFSSDIAMPIESWIKDDTGAPQSLHRIQGIFSGGFELSKLTVDYNGKLKDVVTGSTILDYCVGFESAACYERVRRSTVAVTT